MIGHPTRPKLTGDNMEYWQGFQKYLLRKGHIFFAYPMYCTYATSDSDIRQLIDATSRWESTP